jgi:hypothetical protein
MGAYTQRNELFQYILDQGNSVSKLDPCPSDEKVNELLSKVISSIVRYSESDREREELIALCRLLKEATVHGKGSGAVIEFLMNQITLLLHPAVK